VNHSNKRLLFLILTGVILPLYIYHNPAKWEAIYYIFPAFSLVLRPYPFIEHGREILLVAWMWIIGYGLGAVIIRCLSREENSLPSPAYVVPVGWGVLSFAIFALAMMQILTLSIIQLVLVFLTILSLSYLLFQGNPCSPGFQRIRDFIRDCPWDTRIALCLIAIPLSYAFFSSLMPPTQSDGLRYHLTVPKIYLQHGGFVQLPDLAFSNFPFLIEYLYTIPLAFGLISGPKLIHASFFVLALWSIYRAGERMGDSRTGVFAALIYATIPCAPIFASWSFMEFGLTVYTLLAFHFGIRVVESARAGDESNAFRQAVLLGIACGFLLSCKYTAMITCIFFGLMVLVPVLLIQRILTLSILGRTVLMTAIAVVIFLPWLIKNYVLLGNPVFPFANSVFQSPGWTDFNASFFSYHAGMKGGLNALKQSPLLEWIADAVTLPVRVIFYPGDKALHPESFGSWPLGPLWLILGPLVLFHRQWTYRKAIHALFAFFLFVVWAYTYRDARFLFPCLAVLAPLCAVVIVERIADWSWARAVLLVLVSYNLLFTTGSILIQANAPWWVVGGKIGAEDYLANECGYTRSNIQAFHYLRDHTQPSDKVLLHGIETPFYCPNEFIGSDWFNTDPLIRQSWETPSADALLEWLREREIRYIVYDFGKVRHPGYFQFYRLFRLPLELGLPLLEEMRSKERTRIIYPLAHQDWSRRFRGKIRQAEAQSPNVQALETLLDDGFLEEAFRFEEDVNPESGNDPTGIPIGTVVLKVPPRED